MTTVCGASNLRARIVSPSRSCRQASIVSHVCDTPEISSQMSRSGWHATRCIATRTAFTGAAPWEPHALAAGRQSPAGSRFRRSVRTVSAGRTPDRSCPGPAATTDAGRRREAPRFHERQKHPVPRETLVALTSAKGLSGRGNAAARCVMEMRGGGDLPGSMDARWFRSDFPELTGLEMRVRCSRVNAKRAQAVWLSKASQDDCP